MLSAGFSDLPPLAVRGFFVGRLATRLRAPLAVKDNEKGALKANKLSSKIFNGWLVARIDKVLINL